MADPFTLAIIGFQAFSAIQSFSAARESEKQAQQAVDRANQTARAQIQAGEAARAQAEQQAQAEREAGEFEKTQEKKRQRLAIGRQRALFGGSGITLQGSPLDVLEFQAKEDAIDLLVIEHNAELRAVDLLNQGIATQNQQGIVAQSTFNQGVSQANQLTQQAAGQRAAGVQSLGQAAGTFIGAPGGGSAPVSSFDDSSGREIFVFQGGQTTTLPGVKPVRV